MLKVQCLYTIQVHSGTYIIRELAFSLLYYLWTSNWESQLSWSQCPVWGASRKQSSLWQELTVYKSIEDVTCWPNCCQMFLTVKDALDVAVWQGHILWKRTEKFISVYRRSTTGLYVRKNEGIFGISGLQSRTCNSARIF